MSFRISAAFNTGLIIQSPAAAFPRSTICVNTAPATVCKTDKLIVREAEEPDLGLIVLSFDFSGTRAQLDSTLRQLLWLSGWLTDREVAHQIDWIEPDTLEPQTKSIKTPDDLRELLQTLLRTHLTGTTPSLASRTYPHADWRYHVQPEEQEVQQA